VRAVLLLGTVLVAPLEAQGLGGGGLAYHVQHRVLYAGAVREQTGTFVGAEGSARLGPVRVGVLGLMGTLSGGNDAANPDKKVRASAVTVMLEASPRIAVGAELEAKRFESDAGVTAWRLIGGTGRVALSLGMPGLVGTAQVSYFPSASVVGGAKMGLAFRGTVGASYRSPRGPLTLSLGYRFERFDFKAVGSAPARLEQFRGVIVGAGLRLGR
jgi:hypothetical protein